MQTVSNVLNLAKQAILPALQTARVIVDATAGNGHDTLFLAEHTSDQAKIYAFDIQSAALANTQTRTAPYKARIEYILASHDRIAELVPEEIDVAMFNLGYLPGEGHKVTTEPDSTMRAVSQVLAKLRRNGVCVIVAYPGHEAGAAEAAQLAQALEELPVKKYTVGCYRLCNHVQTAPYVYIIEKVV